MSTSSHMRATRRERVDAPQTSSPCEEATRRNKRHAPQRKVSGLVRLAVLCAVALAFVLQGVPVSALTTVARAAESQEADQDEATAEQTSGAEAEASESAAGAESSNGSEADSSANDGAHEATAGPDQEDPTASGDDISAATTNGAASGADAAAPAAPTGTGTQTDPYIVTTADDLTAALSAAKAEDDTYIALKGIQDAGASTYTLDLGDKTFAIVDKRVVFVDAGVQTSITRSTRDWTTPLFIVGDQAKDAQSNADAAIDSVLTFSPNEAQASPRENPSYLLSYKDQNAPLFRVVKGASLTVNGGNFENNAA